MGENRALEDYERKKQLENERKKPKPAGFQLKDYIAVTVSMVALGLSAMTAYFTVLRVTERLEVTLMQAPELRMTANQTAAWKGSLNLAFVNNGNVPIAVADATMILFQSTKTDDGDECIGDAEAVELSLVTESFVVKPAEIVVKSLAPKEGERQVIKLKNKFKKGEWFHVIGCVQLRFVTSRGGEIDSQSFGAWPRNDPGGVEEAIVYDDFYPVPIRRIPMVFVNRSQMRFWGEE
jgi:hypothetical protein